MKKTEVNFRMDNKLTGGECECGWRGIIFSVFEGEDDDAAKCFSLDPERIFCPICGKREERVSRQ